jgi:hypothetical protein
MQTLTNETLEMAAERYPTKTQPVRMMRLVHTPLN